jgi:nucleoside-diphosphate-sugar epimerase
MPLVVTGAAGFIGHALVELLTWSGHRVVGIDRRPGIPARAEPVVADLTAAPGSPGHAAVHDALAGAEAVFHLAALPGARDHGDRAELARRRHRDNVLAAQRVLDRVPGDVPLVVVSSSSVYGGAWHAGGRPSSEDDPLRPLGGYARSKVELERRCAARAAAGGSIAVARPFTVAGEGQRPDMALARWLAAAAAGRPPELYGEPDRARDVTDVRDVARGLLAMAERGVQGPLNLGTGTAHTLGELIAAVGLALGVEPGVRPLPAPREDPAATLADTTRCRWRLGFVPTTDLDALVRRQAEAAGLVATEPATAGHALA